MFLDKMMTITNSKKMKEKIKVYFFNKLLIGCVQDDLL